MADTLSEQQFALLVKDLKQLPPPTGYSPTFLEMTGFLNWENAWSNILAFYFQSTNGHRLGNGVFRTFMAMLCEEVAPETEVKASREQTTTNRGRIDLVLETEDVVVGIENKVYQVLSNPLDDYRDYLMKRAAGRRVLSGVLSLNPIPKAEQQRFPDWHFVTYKDFCAKLREHLKGNTARPDDKYVVFLNDFVTSILNPGQGDVMDDQRLEFFRQHQAEAEALLKEVAALKADMRRKVEALRATLPAASRGTRRLVQNGLWRSEEVLYDVIWNRVNIAPDFDLVVDVVIELAGWKILFRDYAGYNGRAERWIKERGIPYYIHPEPWRAIVDDLAAPGYNADTEQVHEWVMKYLEKVLPR